MSLESRVRKLERLIENAGVERRPMWARFPEALPMWQVIVLHEALEGRLGEDGERIFELFLLVAAELEDGGRSGALTGDLPTAEMLRVAAENSSDVAVALRELGELLRRHGDPDNPARTGDERGDPFRFVSLVP